MEEDDTERQELDEIARSEGGLVAVTKVIFFIKIIETKIFWSRLSDQNFMVKMFMIATHCRHQGIFHQADHDHDLRLSD